MDKMTDNKIMEALEHCASGEHCMFCCFRGITSTVSDCSKNFLDLINRLQAENERLKNGLAISKKKTKRYKEGYKTANAEIERLKTTQFQFISNANADKKLKRNGG